MQCRSLDKCVREAEALGMVQVKQRQRRRDRDEGRRGSVDPVEDDGKARWWRPGGAARRSPDGAGSAAPLRSAPVHGVKEDREVRRRKRLLERKGKEGRGLGHWPGALAGGREDELRRWLSMVGAPGGHGGGNGQTGRGGGPAGVTTRIWRHGEDLVLRMMQHV